MCAAAGRRDFASYHWLRHGTGRAKLMNGRATTAMKLCILFVASYVPGVTSAAGPPATCPKCVPVFWEGLEGSSCYRIPTIIQTHTGTILAFAVNRIDSCHDQSNHSLVLRRSTDGGSSFGPIITIAQGHPPPNCSGCPAAISSPSPVEVERRDGSYHVLLVYETLNNPKPTKHGVDMMVWSEDDGLTWGRQTVLSYPPLENVGCMSGPGVGIQASDGAIFFSLRQLTGEEFLLVSRDFGQSFRASTLGPKLSECSIAFVPGSDDARILMNCRPDEDHRRRQLEWSAANGTNMTAPTSLPEMVDPSCAGSIASVNGTIYASHANTTSGRSHMVVQRSEDGGATYDSGTLVWGGPSGYSQLVALASKSPAVQSQQLGLLFEAGCANCHAWHFSQQIVFVRL